jgi:putative FmdB family regulatory protein
LTKGASGGIKEIVPLYEYECQECGHRFEMLQKVADSPLKACVKCKGKVERLLSSPAIQFKGSGWYITDYARKGQSPSTQSSEKSSDSEKSSEKGSGSTSKAAKSDKHRSESGPAASASSTSKE